MQQLRHAGPNERRYIVRQALDYYRSLIVGGIFTCSNIYDDVSRKEAITKALKHCIAVHPLLTAAIADEETEAPSFVRPATLDLDNHIELLDAQQFPDTQDEKSLVKDVLLRTHDEKLTSREKIPPWKVVVLPLPSQGNAAKDRFLVLFAYYHSHGDGKSGLAFNRTFLSGLQLASTSDCPYNGDRECATPDTPLLPTMEAAGNLRVSWSYLLSPLVGAYLPKFIAEPLGLRASVALEAEDQWKGRDTFYDAEDFRSGVELVSVKSEDVQNILQKCRAHNTKLTGLIHQLIVRSLSRVVSTDKAGSFLSQTAVDLRRSLKGISVNDMALCVTGRYELFKRVAINDSNDWATATSDDPLWQAARETSEGLAKCASTLEDQPVGLMPYLRSVYPWMRGLVGTKRENSYEVSNIMAFNLDPSDIKGPWDVESMIFSQPANATSAFLCFNVVSKDGGDLVITIGWQVGALGMEDENDFVAKIGASIGSDFETLARV